MGELVDKLNIWIDSSLSPALSAFQRFMDNRTEQQHNSDEAKLKAVEEFNQTYELLMLAMTELRKVFAENTKYPLLSSCATSDKFKENCVAFNLTDREIEIIKLIAMGKSNKVIGNSLFISEKTVESHVSRIFKKVQVKNRITLITKLELQYIPK